LSPKCAHVFLPAASTGAIGHWPFFFEIQGEEKGGDPTIDKSGEDGRDDVGMSPSE